MRRRSIKLLLLGLVVVCFPVFHLDACLTHTAAHQEVRVFGLHVAQFETGGWDVKGLDVPLFND